MEKIKTNLGITLTILVIVIIVLVILAGVSLNIVLGENGIINRGQEASIQATVKKVAEDLKMAYKDVYEELEGEEITAIDIATKMIDKYRI